MFAIFLIFDVRHCNKNAASCTAGTPTPTMNIQRECEMTVRSFVFSQMLTLAYAEVVVALYLYVRKTDTSVQIDAFRLGRVPVFFLFYQEQGFASCTMMVLNVKITLVSGLKYYIGVWGKLALHLEQGVEVSGYFQQKLAFRGDRGQKGWMFGMK